MLNYLLLRIARLLNKRRLVNNRILYGEYPTINGLIYIINNGAISFGKKVIINSSFLSNPIGGDTRTLLVCEKNATIEIGSNVGISNSTLYAKESICIKDHVMIGGSCKIYDSDFHPINPELRLQDGRKNVRTGPVTIETNAFIGAHSIILKNVTIGENSVVGAGSVVTKSIPSNEIWAGNPAHFIKNVK